VRYHPLVPTFTRDEVQRLAQLARLELTADEADLFARQLGDILVFARQIETVDTTSVRAVPLAAPFDTQRDDIVRPSLDREDVLEGAPDADLATGLFKVPRVITG
jgi:aspartyl-tRNA(Asn)/glutamyl-tRNA(Gln) amidotransferase subunit C